MVQPFHLAIQVKDLAASRKFYGGVLACEEGRSSSQWIDFNLYGHQLVCHENKDMVVVNHHGDVDGHSVPTPHFGVVLDMADWQALADRLTEQAVPFIIEPHIRFKGEAGEQATLFFLDPSGNALEFKAFADINAQLFAK